MNSKFSTLMAGALLALSTSAFAAGIEERALTKVTAWDENPTSTSFVSGNSYYIVVDENSTLETSDILVGQNLTSGELGAYHATLAQATSLESNYLWKVTEIKSPTARFYTFYNSATKSYLAIEKDGDTNNGKMVTVPANAVDGKDGVSIYFQFADGAAYNGSAAVISTTLDVANKQLKITNDVGDATTTVDTGTEILLYQKAQVGLGSGELNSLMGSSFMFNFPDADPAPATNPFGNKIVAVEVPATDGIEGIRINNTQVTADNIYVSNDARTEAGEVYFVTSVASSGTVKADNGKYYFTSKTKFEASKFLTVDPIANYNINGFTIASGDGFKFRTVSGEDLVKTAAKGKVMYDNAQFTVTEVNPTNGKGDYEITVTPAVTAAKKADGTAATEADADVASAVNVVSFTTMGASYVTTMSGATYNNSKENTVKIAKVSSSSVLAAKDLLKSDAPAVFNIQFTNSKADLNNEDGKSSEYGKYLGLSKEAAAYGLLAQGSAFLDLDAPQNQWYVADVQSDIFTFKNRESATELKLQLRKTDTENVYDVLSSEEVTFKYAYVNANGQYKTETGRKAFHTGGIQVKLVPATIKKSAGYLDLAKEDLANPIQIKFTVANTLWSKNMYVVANTTTKTISLTEDEDLATLWDVVKFAAKEDSISGKITYAYMKDEKTMDTKELVDKAITTYALKINGADYYLDYPKDDGNDNFMIKNTDKIAKAQRYILKERANGSIYLIAASVATSNAYAENIAYDTEALSIGQKATLEKAGVYGDATDGVQMEFESVELLSTSLEAEPRHASFKSVNGGFLGMDENNNAIIAATQEEAKTLTFWLDTTDVKELSTNFYISQAMPEGLKAAEPRMFLFNPADSVSYYDEGTASTTKDYSYMLSDKATTKAIFKAATLINKDSINTIIKGEEVGFGIKDDGLNRFKFQIVEANEDGDEYAIKSGNAYLTSINGKIGFGGVANALIVSLGEGDATANEAIEAAGVQVIGGQGVVTVQGAAGKVITVANILGQTIANQVAASDNVTIAAPAGVVVVAVDGDATKVVVK